MPVKKVQWYQSQDTVTASLLVRELRSRDPPSQGGGTDAGEELTAHCDRQRCSIAVNGKEVWSIRLAGHVIPDQCRLCVGKVRAELKLTKAEPVKWSDYTATDTEPAVATETTQTPPPSRKALMPDDLLYLNHLPHDFHDLEDGGEVKVRVQLPGVEPGQLAVHLQENIMEVQFRTSDPQFLRSHDGDPTSTFVWQIHLYDSILPAESVHSSSHAHLELSLKKATPTSLWRGLEALAPSSAIIATPSSSKINLNPTNQMQERRDLTNQIIVDDDFSEPLNNLSNPPTNETTSKRQDFSHNFTSPPTRVAMETNDTPHQVHRPSLTGLCNLGNTCFMNSVIQCLSNTPELRKYFINGRYLADLNKENPLGFKGELAKHFSAIVRKLWSGDYEHFSPRKLKSVIAARSSSYGGYQQQDSHEFMSYLLDGLHEDLNRIRDKPQTAVVEPDGRLDRETAQEAWRVHRLRNDSFFVDHFQGQFKSTLVCPTCNKESVTFDPYMSVSVPLPKKLRRLPVIFVPRSPDLLPRQYVLKLPHDASLELLKASVARRTGISMTQLRVFEAYGGKFHNLLSSNRQPITSIKENDVIIVSEVLSRREAEDEVVEINVIQRVQYPIFPKRCAECRCEGGEGGEGVRMLRCGQCKAVGYCSRACQMKDWKAHKNICRQGRPVPVGLPFVVSLPAGRLTYSNLANMAEQFARRSVDVERRTRDVPCSSQDGITDSIQGEITENVQNKEKQPMYVFTLVDKYGESRDGACELEDGGGAGGVVSVGGKFLAMDWRNNPTCQDGVVVQPKPTMEFTPDPVGGDSAVAMATDAITLEQCLELFTEPETLTKEEAWYCPRCKEHREATKQLLLWRLPQVLVLHLKRFSFHNVLFRDKIDKLVQFPLVGLDLAPYMHPAALAGKTTPPYDLYGVVNHFGSVHMGHYTATVKAPPSSEAESDNNHWLWYDDESVKTLPEDMVVREQAYILFYQRRHC